MTTNGRLLEEINNRHLMWDELENALITKVDERISKDGKKYVVDMEIEIADHGTLAYTICGDVIE